MVLWTKALFSQFYLFNMAKKCQKDTGKKPLYYSYADKMQNYKLKRSQLKYALLIVITHKENGG